ncbi:hypothetical protein NY057_05275 [Curtobacterium flaccumfaciens]|uniref:hypothetical protein n=1 Tax=Curtobacterium flaccumfaciens TaxID=2035 RepID=UPI0021FA45F2|nr:hypothetical protein [Curtobacterium flaccumfaciens]UWD83657.1 hypothetical protein NY057_05275 [Curtobacterium flaccumfaciens]
MSRSAHVAAVLDRLRAHQDLASRVFSGNATKDASGKPRTRYVTTWVGTPRRVEGRYGGQQDVERYRFTLHATSVDPTDAGDIDDAITEQLLGWTPTIAGRICRPMRTDDESSEMEYDSDLDPPLYWIPSTWELVTEPEASA